jgi:hypothetical protein
MPKPLVANPSMNLMEAYKESDTLHSNNPYQKNFDRSKSMEFLTQTEATPGRLNPKYLERLSSKKNLELTKDGLKLFMVQIPLL